MSNKLAFFLVALFAAIVAGVGYAQYIARANCTQAGGVFVMQTKYDYICIKGGTVINP